MRTPEAEHENERRAEYEFLEKLVKLVLEYRTEVRLGCLVGALETIKFRLYREADLINNPEKDKSDDSREGE